MAFRGYVNVPSMPTFPKPPSLGPPLRHPVARRSLLTLAALGVALSLPAGASAATVVRTVPATVAIFTVYSPTNPLNCGVVAMGQWADVPGTVSATVRWTFVGQPQARGGTPPFDDSRTFVGPLIVPPGNHWLLLGGSSAAGVGAPDACVQMEAKTRTSVSTQATVDLTIDRPGPARISPVPSALVLGSTRQALLGRVTCPRGGSCAVTAPRTVRVTIASRSYTLRVTAPKFVRGGRTAGVSVTFTQAAASALKGRSVRPGVRVQTTNQGVTRATRVVKRTIRGRVARSV